MSERVLEDAAATVSVTLYDGETPTDASAMPTVEVVRDDGTVLVAAGTAASDPTPGDGSYSFQLTPTHTSRVDRLEVRWTATVGGATQAVRSQVEVVGGYYFPLAELRAERNLSDTVKFTTAELARARAWAETVIERWVGVSFVRRYHRHHFAGDASSRLFLPHLFVTDVLAAELDGATLDVSAWTVEPFGRLHADTTFARPTFASPAPNGWVAYAHGLDAVPVDVAEAAKDMARHHLLEDQSGRPVLSVGNELGGTTRFGFAGDDRPTGYPDIDVVLNHYRSMYRVPVVA